MTQLSPKSNNRKNSNGRLSHSKINQITQIEDLTSGANLLPYPPGQVPSYPKQKASKQSQIEEMEPSSRTPKTRLKQWNVLQWFSRSLGVKAMALAIAIGTVPVLGIGTFAYLTTNQGVEKSAFKNLEISTLDLADKLVLFIDERYRDILIYANLAIFTDAKVGKAYTTEQKNALLNEYVKASGVYNSIAIADLKGEFLYKSDAETLDNVTGIDWFEAVKKTDRPFITEPRISQATGIYSVLVAAPVKDSVTGQTTSVIRARFPVEAFKEVYRVTNERRQDIFAFDSKNTIYFSTVEGAVGKTIEQVFPLMTANIKKVGRKQQSIFGANEQTKIKSIEVFLPSQRLKEQYGLDWSLIVATEQATALATRDQLLISLLAGTGITVVAVGAFSAFIGNRATRPIVEAASTVDKIGQGQLDTRMEIQGEDELGVLGANINQMAEQLENFVQEQELAAEQALLLAKVTGSRTLNSRDLEDLFNNTLEEARQLLNADRIVIYRLNADGSGFISTESVAAGLPRALNYKIDGSYIPEQMLQSYVEGRIMPINNIYEAELYPEQQRLLERLQVKANLEVPVLHEGKPYALLMVHYCLSPHEWQPSEVNFFKQLAAQLGLSIDRVILLEQTEQLAEEQRQLKEGLQKRALQLLQEVDPISKGDLTTRAKVTADEIGTIADAYNSTVGSLRKIVLQVQKAAGQVAQTTSTNEASIQALSQEALRQAEEISLALQRAQDMAESVRLVAINARQAEEAVKQAQETVYEGDQAMNRTVDGILAIRETVAETAKKVKHLGESSQKISTVVNLISNFAAQTNLLALNASIEAARAGEEGRGFAVVADEVRALARQSAEATSEIEKLVAAIQAETNEVVAAMEAGTEQVVMGTKLVEETRHSLNKITEASTQINELVEFITQATVVQSQASEEVTKTMTNVAQIAEKTSQEASRVSSSFEELLTVAQAMQEDVGLFKVS